MSERFSVTALSVCEALFLFSLTSVIVFPPPGPYLTSGFLKAPMPEVAVHAPLSPTGGTKPLFMKQVFTALLLFSLLSVTAQKQQEYALSFTNNATAFPFGILSGYTSSPVHPGVELAWSQTLREKAKHDWYRTVTAGYFFHRFIQHGIPLYVNYGYRYKFTNRFVMDASLGGGYFHSIPATEVLKADENGNYRNAKGIGRPQAMLAVTLGTGYRVILHQQPVRLFLQYQVRLQTPFVRSYVPVLPYNQLAAGAAMRFPFVKKTTTP